MRKYTNYLRPFSIIPTEAFEKAFDRRLGAAVGVHGGGGGGGGGGGAAGLKPPAVTVGSTKREGKGAVGSGRN